MKNVRSSQTCISMNFCSEFSKAQVLPCEHRYIIKLPLTAPGCYSTIVTLFTHLNNKLFSHDLKILTCDELWKSKKSSDKNRPFAWIKSND